MSRRRKSDRLEPQPFDPRVPGVMRFTVEEHAKRLEVTCLTSEVDVIREWLEQHGVASMAVDLPVPEYTQWPWHRDYRWSFAAEQQWIACWPTTTKAVPR